MRVLNLKERTRTFSSDSGCDVVYDSLDLHSSSLENTVRTWEAKLGEVVRQEVKRAKDITDWATEAVKIFETDDDKREKILARWRSQMKNIVDFTNDLLERVNIDTNNAIICTAEKYFELEYSFIIEEQGEDDKKEEETEELLQLFKFSPKCKINDENKKYKRENKSAKVDILAVKNKNKAHKKSLKISKRMKTAYSKAVRQVKVKRQSSPKKDITSQSNENDFNLNICVSLSDAIPEYFQDWKWTSSEHDIECSEELLQTYHQEDYWSEKVSCDLSAIKMIDEQAQTSELSYMHNFVHPELSTVIFVPEEQEKEMLTKWHDWHKFGSEWDIFKDNKLVSSKKTVAKHKQNIPDVFWKICLVIKKEPRFLDVMHNLPVWDSPDIFLDSDSDLPAKNEKKILAKDPVNIFKTFRNIFNEPRNYYHTHKTEVKESDNDNSDSISNWDICHKSEPSWNISYVKVVLNQSKKYDLPTMEAFWNISMNEKYCRSEPSLLTIQFNLPVHDWPDIFTQFWDPSENVIANYDKNGNKDPVNIFKSFRHIFTEPVEEKDKYKNKSKIKTSEKCEFKDISWINCEKFGSIWDSVARNDSKVDFIKRKDKKKSVPTINIMDTFWKINFDESCCCKERSLLEEIQNLPVWCSTDVFEDVWDVEENEVVKANINKQKDPVNIFKSFRRIFNRSEKYQKKDKINLKRNCVLQKVEDIFSAWMVNVLDTQKGKRKIISEECLNVGGRADSVKKLRRDPIAEITLQEQKLLELLENLTI